MRGCRAAMGTCVLSRSLTSGGSHPGRTPRASSTFFRNGDPSRCFLSGDSSSGKVSPGPQAAPVRVHTAPCARAGAGRCSSPEGHVQERPAVVFGTHLGVGGPWAPLAAPGYTQAFCLDAPGLPIFLSIKTHDQTELHVCSACGIHFQDEIGCLRAWDRCRQASGDHGRPRCTTLCANDPSFTKIPSRVRPCPSTVGPSPPLPKQRRRDS